MLCINPELRREGKNSSSPLFDYVGSDSLDTTEGVSLDTRSSDSLDTHIKKDLKKKNKEKHYIDFKKIDDIPFLKIYLNLYQKVKGKKHVRISDESFTFIQQQIDYLIEMGVTEEEWEKQTTLYLENEIPKGNNGSIVYFLEITYKYFEVGRYDQFDK
ncbi:hypothetical protein D3C71_1401670 [compost metagenome]